jgi:RNA polymerase sigma factor (sigma-70 family)
MRSVEQRSRISATPTKRSKRCRRASIEKRRTYRGEGRVEAWVWRIVLNAIRDRYRERAHHALVVDGVHEASTPSGNGHLSTELVGWAVRCLPERQRLVLFLRFYADMDYSTIASLLDMSEGTVGASLNAARATLRKLMEGVRT